MPADCPWLPLPSRPLTAASLTEAGDQRGEAFYLLALECAQALWRQQLPAQSLLMLNRAWSADLRGDEPVLARWPAPYAAAAWVMHHRDPATFIGNPRRHYQHLATRMVEPRRQPRQWRAWACWALACIIEPAWPADEKQLADEGVVEPDEAAIAIALGAFGWAGEAGVWQSVLDEARQRRMQSERPETAIVRAAPGRGS